MRRLSLLYMSDKRTNTTRGKPFHKNSDAGGDSRPHRRFNCKACKNINVPLPMPSSLVYLPDLIAQALHIKMSAQ